MASFYISITQSFAESMNGKQSIVNQNSFFGYAVTTSGQYVTAIGAIYDFPDDMASIAPLTTIVLNDSDFPSSAPADPGLTIPQ